MPNISCGLIGENQRDLAANSSKINLFKWVTENIELNVQVSFFFREIFTGRNEVVAKVVFTRVCDSVHGRGSPGSPPGTWQGEPPPRDLAGRTPPPGTWQGDPPWKKTAAYGQ